MNMTLIPRRFESLDIRLYCGLAVLWSIGLITVAGYLIFLPIALNYMGMNPLEAALTYLSDISPALEQVLVVAAGAWILFSYLCSVAVPPAEAIERRESLTHHGYHTFRALLFGFVLSILPLRIPFFTRSLERVSLNDSLPRRPSDDGLPELISLGWSPAVNPPLVYE